MFRTRSCWEILEGETMAADDFFRARLDGIVDTRHPAEFECVIVDSTVQDYQTAFEYWKQRARETLIYPG